MVTNYAVYPSTVPDENPIFYLTGFERGKDWEREDTRKFVNAGMTKAGFCRWFTMSRLAEDCAKEATHD